MHTQKNVSQIFLFCSILNSKSRKWHKCEMLRFCWNSYTHFMQAEFPFSKSIKMLAEIIKQEVFFLSVFKSLFLFLHEKRTWTVNY